MIWNRKRQLAASPFNETVETTGIPDELIDIMDSIDAEYILMDGSEHVVQSSLGISTFNIVRETTLLNEHLLRLVRATRRSGQPQETTMELPRGPIGGGIHTLFIRVTPLGDNGLIAILIFDDSEMRRLDSIRRDFVANISHELKTPIGALSILSEAVLGAADDPDAITRFAGRMQIEAKRLSELVQEIIDLSRLQDNDPLTNGKVFNIADAIKEAIEQTRMSYEAKKISVSFSPIDQPQVLGDRDQVVMAIHNLVEKAVNYSPQSTRVAVTLKENDGLIEVSISDQGIGIPDKDLERIFERFYRVDAARSRETGGTGLGLSIVKHVATNHGGDVSVWSVEGAGSTFTIRFPQANAQERLQVGGTQI